MTAAPAASAAFSRRLTISQIALLVRAFAVSCFVFRTVERNSGRSLASGPDARRRQIGQYIPLQFQPNRDFPALAALFLKPQHVLLAVVLEILQPQLGDRPRPGRRYTPASPGSPGPAGPRRSTTSWAFCPLAFTLYVVADRRNQLPGLVDA